MTTPINENVIKKISKGDEKAFALLYDAYYTYLNSVALCYIFNRTEANEVVNDVFLHVWNKRETLMYPIHTYLTRSVQNGCLNKLRSSQTQERVLSEHKEQLLRFQEEYILSTPTPMQYLETQEVEQQVRSAVNLLPEKCRIIFEDHFYHGKSPEEIAQSLNLSINTVRVQLKNALDKLKITLSHLIGLFLLLLMR